MNIKRLLASAAARGAIGRAGAGARRVRIFRQLAFNSHFMDRRTLIIGVLGLAALLGLVFFFRGRMPDGSSGGDGEALADWTVYQNEEFGFELRHPRDWQATATTSFGTPMINVYPRTTAERPPFTHHSAVTQVSLFPRGVPTEGVFSQSRDSTREIGSEMKEAVEQALDFLLGDGEVWARFIIFRNPPASWQFGFVWAAVQIENGSSQCFRNGNEIPEAQCDPLTGDEVVIAGDIDSSARETADMILSTIRFVR